MDSNILLILSILFLILYGIQIYNITKGWYRIKRETQSDYKKRNNFSIIIPVRNESKNILFLLKDIELLDYNRENFQVIFVDNESTDNTSEIINEFIKTTTLNVYLIHSYGGKKQALLEGVKNSEFQYIITTDGDCRLNRNWLIAINNKIDESDYLMLSGPVRFVSSKSRLSKFFELEFASLVSAGAGSIGIKKPIMVNAANLIFRKDVYLSLKDKIKSEISSGDDIFLMLAIKKKYGAGRIGFIKSENAMVETQPPFSIKEFVNQRIRWASKAKYYRDYDVIYSALIVLFFNILLLAVLIKAVLYTQLIFVFIFTSLILLKSLIDYSLLSSFLKFTRKKSLRKYIFAYQFIYPFYIGIISILSLLMKVKWKGRAVKT